MLQYVAGFLFSEDREHVLLVKKNRPAWQAGLLNGIGGKVEPNENFHSAMVREFREEAGLDIPYWVQTVSIRDLRYELRFYRAFSNQLHEARSMTDEPVAVYRVATLWNEPVVSNLRWIIPLVLDPHVGFPMSVLNTGGN